MIVGMVVYLNDPWDIADVGLRLTVRFDDSVAIHGPQGTARDLSDQLGAASQAFAPRVALVRWVSPVDEAGQIDIGYVTDERTNVDAIARAPGIVVEVVSTGLFALPQIQHSTVETTIPDFWGGENERVVVLSR